MLDDGVTVDQRSKDGFTWKQCAINWPSGPEVAEFRTALDLWNVMFPFQFFFGDEGVLHGICITIDLPRCVNAGVRRS